jgi:hypothetical protein
MCDACSQYEDAIINQHLDCVKRLESINTNYDKSVGYCSMAAFSGHFEILQYLIDNFENDFSEPVCNYAVIGGSLCCLIAAHSVGFHMSSKEITQNAALRGDISCLRYAIEHGCNCEEHICEFAVSKDSFICLVYLLNKGYICTELTCVRARLNGINSDCYNYMVSHNLCNQEEMEEYAGLSLAQAISRYHRRRSYNFLSISTGNGEHGYIRSWRNSRNRRNAVLYIREDNVPFFKNYDEIVGR